MDRSAPPGFERHFRTSPMTDPWEPIYSRRTERAVIIGLWADTPHLNSRGLVHGGLMTTLADNAMGLSCALHLESGPRLLTANLNIDFLSVAEAGRWIAVETTFVKPGRTMCFAQAFISADGEICARANAVFRVAQPRNDDSKRVER
ncbi:MAG: PaaI family thioesterase [Hyphomicrobiales bacterium]|nr:PaaI family thioesterase [Hyphomicrobiales bacterium]